MISRFVCSYKKEKKKKKKIKLLKIVKQYLVSLTIIFQTAWHFASASGLKFSHDDQNYVQFQWNLHAYQTQT